MRALLGIRGPSASGGYRGVPSMRRTPVLLPHQANARIVAEAFDHLDRVVCRTVVDDHELEIPCARTERIAAATVYDA